MRNQMKTKTKKILMAGLIATVFSSSVVLTGCAGASREQKGAILGSVLGGAAGHQFGKGKGKDVMTVVGAVVGGMIGGNVGREMDRQDQQKISHTLETAPNYKKVSWDNQRTNKQYTFTPVNNYEGNVNGSRTTCRDYMMDVYIDGRMQQVKGRACKNNQGQWINAS